MRIRKHNDLFDIYHNRKKIVDNLNIKDLAYIGQKNKNSASWNKFKTIIPIVDPEADLSVLANQINTEILDFIPDEVEEEPEPAEEVLIDKSVTSYEGVGNIVTRTLGESFEEKYKIMMATIVSMWYAETESVYLIMLAKPGSGKSTLCECFDNCEDAHTTDSLTPHALDPGQASKDQDVIGVLDEAENKTLIVHDMTAIFSENPQNVKRWKGVFENIFGKVGYNKSSPGCGTKRYGKRLNLIFGITPYVFWQKYPGTKKGMGLDLINSERYLYMHLPIRNQYDDYIEGRIVRDLSEIKRKTSGFLFNLKERIFNPEITKETRIKIGNVVAKGDRFNKHTATRRMKQCEMFCKALMLIEGKTEIDDSHLDIYDSLLLLKENTGDSI